MLSLDRVIRILHSIHYGRFPIHSTITSLARLLVFRLHADKTLPETLEYEQVSSLVQEVFEVAAGDQPKGIYASDLFLQAFLGSCREELRRVQGLGDLLDQGHREFMKAVFEGVN